jgi:hypothetical protein
VTNVAESQDGTLIVLGLQDVDLSCQCGPDASCGLHNRSLDRIMLHNLQTDLRCAEQIRLGHGPILQQKKQPLLNVYLCLCVCHGARGVCMSVYVCVCVCIYGLYREKLC